MKIAIYLTDGSKKIVKDVDTYDWNMNLKALKVVKRGYNSFFNLSHVVGVEILLD